MGVPLEDGVADVIEPSHDGFTVVNQSGERSKAKDNNNANRSDDVGDRVMKWSVLGYLNTGNGLRMLTVELVAVVLLLVDGHNMYKVVSKLKALKTPLRKLLHDQGNLHERVNLLRVELDTVQRALDANPMDTNLRDEEAVYLNAFNEAKLDEERFLKQKAKVEWLEAGDSNSSYFHKTVKARNQYCRIEVILDSNNVEVAGALVPEVFVNHYEEFLGNHSVCDDLNIDGLFHSKVSDQSCLSMVRDITNNEIKNAMFNIGDDAPGPEDTHPFL
ncbi:hypothetical protein Tco_0614763 [Tanacetum coccineum]